MKWFLWSKNTFWQSIIASKCMDFSPFPFLHHCKVKALRFGMVSQQFFRRLRYFPQVKVVKPHATVIWDVCYHLHVLIKLKLWCTVTTLAFSLPECAICQAFMSHHSVMLCDAACEAAVKPVSTWRIVHLTATRLRRHVLLFSNSMLVGKRPQNRHISRKLNFIIYCLLTYRNAAAGMNWAKR